MDEGGRDAGASLDIPAYLRGDLNGDGLRELPAAPAPAYGEVHTLDE